MSGNKVIDISIDEDCGVIFDDNKLKALEHGTMPIDLTEFKHIKKMASIHVIKMEKNPQFCWIIEQNGHFVMK
jgi:hypothetical protein